MTITFASIQTVGKIAERSSPSSCDGADYEFWSVFDECVEFCKKKWNCWPDTRGMLSKCRFDDAEGTQNCAFELMAWLSREGWLHDVKFLLVQGGAEGTDERVLALRTVRFRVRDDISHFSGGRT